VKDFLRGYSHIANTVFNLTTIYKAYAQSRSDKDPVARHKNRTTMDGVYGDPADDAWREAWQVTEEILRQWHKETQDAGEIMLLVFLTESIQLDDGYTNPKGLDLTYPNRRLTEFARANGIPYLDFLSYAKEQVSRRGMKYPFLSWEFDGHYSQVGHQLLADFLEPRLRRETRCGITNLQ
jgi:hypothetical protein